MYSGSMEERDETISGRYRVIDGGGIGIMMVKMGSKGELYHQKKSTTNYTFNYTKHDTQKTSNLTTNKDELRNYASEIALKSHVQRAHRIIRA